MKIITLEEYLGKVPPDFIGDRAKEAMRLIYTENTIIDKDEYKGRKYYIVEGKDGTRETRKK